MNKNTTTPKPPTYEQPADKGLDGAACSRDEISDTPRTDAFCNDLQYEDDWSKWQMTASFAGQLERDLAVMQNKYDTAIYALRAFEWNGNDKGSRCMCCYAHISEGHKSDCCIDFILANEIGEARADNATPNQNQTL